MMFRVVVMLSMALLAAAFVPARIPKFVPRQQSMELQMNNNNVLKNILTTAMVGFSFLSTTGIARAEIDYDGIKYLGGGSKIDLNNANVRSYLDLKGMYPTIASKIVNNGPFKTVADIYNIPGLSNAEKDILKKYESKFVTLEPKPEYVLGNNEALTVHLARAYQAAEGIGSKVYVFGGQAESYENLLSDLLVLETEVCPPSLLEQCIRFIASKDTYFTTAYLQSLPAELVDKIVQQTRIMEVNKNYLKNTDQGSLENASIASLTTETVDISEMSAQNEENEDESDSIFFGSFYDSMLSTISDKNLDEDTLHFHIQQIIALLGLETTIQQMNVPQNKLKDTLIRILLFAKMQLQLEPLDNHPEEEEEEDTSDNMSTVAVASHASERNPTTATADDNVSVITDDMSLNSMNLQEEEDSDSQES